MKRAQGSLTMTTSLLALAIAPWLVSGCATHREDLARGQRAYEQSSHERALAIFRSMEPDLARLFVGERAHYAYLRGMTDFRIGYRLDARHWLALARAIDEQAPGSLPAEWKTRINDALTELNTQVHDQGIENLTNALAHPGSVEGSSEGGNRGTRNKDLDKKKKRESDDEP